MGLYGAHRANAAGGCPGSHWGELCWCVAVRTGIAGVSKNGPTCKHLRGSFLNLVRFVCVSVCIVRYVYMCEGFCLNFDSTVWAKVGLWVLFGFGMKIFVFCLRFQKILSFGHLEVSIESLLNIIFWKFPPKIQHLTSISSMHLVPKIFIWNKYPRPPSRTGQVWQSRKRAKPL